MNGDRFKVEVDQKGCRSCGHGKLYSVVDKVEDIARSVMYEDEGQADEHCQELNAAYRLGVIAGRKEAKS